MILVGFGANLPSCYGVPAETFLALPALLERYGIYVLESSSLWESAPVPVSDQPWYKNAVLSVRTELSSEDMMDCLHKIERQAGRMREKRNAARSLDLDLLAYHDTVQSCSYVSLPHPRMHERAFVLYPLREIAPNWIHPSMKNSLSELIESLPSNQVVRRTCILGGGGVVDYV